MSPKRLAALESAFRCYFRDAGLTDPEALTQRLLLLLGDWARGEGCRHFTPDEIRALAAIQEAIHKRDREPAA